VQVLRRYSLQVGALIFVTTALALSAQAASFSEANLKGSYSYMLHKWTVAVGKNQYAEVGVMTFDGAGNMTGSATAVGGGVPKSGTLSGTYTVNPIGSGTIKITSILSNPPTYYLGFVLNSISSGLAHSFQFAQIGNHNNVVISGSAQIQSATAMQYSAASLQGSFTFLYNSWSADPKFDEIGGIGILTFDGAGNLEGWLTGVDRGVAQLLTFTGSYLVNSDGTCSGSLELSNSSTTTLACALNSVGAQGASGLNLLVTNEGPSGADNSTNYALTLNAAKQGTP